MSYTDTDIGPHYHRGEWAMLGYDQKEHQAAMVHSPFWNELPITRKLFLLQQWMDVLSGEYDHLVAAE